MNRIKRAFLMACAIFVVYACEDSSKAPIVTFDSAGHGGYPRLITEGDKLINVQTQADFDASSYSYTIEFVDEAQGRNVAEYVLTLELQDNDASNGDNSVSGVELRRYSASDFSPNAQGYMELAGVSISSGDVAAAAGVSYADMTAGDNFLITGSVIMTNGDVFTGANSSASVEGAAFRGHFDFILPAACPSSIEGTYDYSTVTWCGNTVTGTVDIEALGGGEYGFSDWSFGAYGDCWGGGVATGDHSFNDVCRVVTINDGTDSFGDSWTFSSVINGNDWEITWLNFTYNSGLENGVSTITFPGGVPFTLAP